MVVSTCTHLQAVYTPCLRAVYTAVYTGHGRVRAVSTADVCCGQTAGWIKMALGVEVGLDPDHIVLDGDPAPLPKKWAEPPNFELIFIVAKRLDASRCHLLWR